MKKIYLLFTIASTLVLMSCSDYLDESPDNRVEANDLDKLSELLVRAYPRAEYLFTDWMTDDSEYISSNSQSRKVTALYKWEDADTYDDINTPSYYWNQAYKAISHANTVLDKLNKLKFNDPKRVEAVKGEALLCRSYAHFMLVSLFGNNYNEATSSQDLGVPYVTDVEDVLIKEYKRNTVKVVFELAEKDLLEGIKLVKDDYYKGSKKYHFTKTAAYAFASRFYLFKGEYAESIKYADLLLGASTVNAAMIKDMGEYDKQSGRLAKCNFFIDNSDASNILMIEKLCSIMLRHYIGYRTGDNAWLDRFIRQSSVWAGSRGDTRSSMGYGRDYVITAKFKEEFHKESLTATTGYPFFMQPVFRGIELVYNRIESNIALGNLDLALADLNRIAKFRYKNPIDATIQQVQDFYKENDVVPNEKEALMTLLLDEKRKEFLQEGMRWFDIKRHGIEVKHVTASGEEFILTKDDKRKVLQIPASATSRGMIKNPR